MELRNWCIQIQIILQWDQIENTDISTNPENPNFEEAWWFCLFWCFINVNFNIHFHVTNSWFEKPSDEQFKSRLKLQQWINISFSATNSGFRAVEHVQPSLLLDLIAWTLSRQWVQSYTFQVI